MDAKDLRTESALGDRSNDGNSKYPQGSSVLQCNRNKPYQDIGSNSLAKVDVPTARPCAVIGPDRVVPPSVPIDTYLKKGPVEPWPGTDNTYRRPPEYPHKLSDYHHPTRNISPRQTFQENMQRIMVPPSYNTSKIKEDHNFPVDPSISSLRNNKINVPTEAKYCDVPYAVNPMTNEQKNIRNTDISVSNMNSALARSAHHVWPPANANIRPSKPYGAPEIYQYPEYQSCAGPRPMLVPRPHRTVHEDPGHVYSDPYYTEATVRFKPYPTVKERYPQTRYEYINYSNPFPPPPFPSHNLQKSLPPHAYPGYSQVPLKYLDTRMAEPVINGYQRPLNQQTNFPTAPYRNQVIHPNYGPISGNCLQSNKFYPYTSDNSIKTVTNKLPYDANHKIYGDYENCRTKTYPMSESFYVNEMARSHHLKGQVLAPNYPAVNMHSVPSHPFYRKENPTLKNYEYGPHFRNIDPSININGNILSRLPSQFSPNSIAISPSDSNTSNDTTQTQGTSQDDCGYVSQSSSASIRSVESGLSRMPNDLYRRFDYRYGPVVRSSHLISKLERNSNIGSKNKKDIDVRQFLQMWNEGEDENGENTNKETLKTVPNSNNNITNRYELSNKDQLYVLGLVNVPSEELGKYEHIQKVSKLPENIKGYNSIELLNQFEEVIESSNLNNYHVKPPTPRDFHMSLKSSPSMQGIGIPSRPISPLDVEAKISQSVIHKEVGCNFEIKPCSPKMLNVEVAAPIQAVLGERLIEKVSNPLTIQSPILHNVDEKIDNCNSIKHQDRRISLNENAKVPSCKLINTQCSSNDPVDSVKTNYSFQDLESNSGVCLASLPRLDNDIELNFPEVNQQFINANKVESVITTTPKDLPSIEINQSEMLPDRTVHDSELNNFSPNIEFEKESPKLSKYRKLKRKGTETKDAQTSAQAMRTDSVIIKNPENLKSLEDSGDHFPPPVRKSTQDAQQNPINLSVNTVDRLNYNVELNSSLNKFRKNEIAIDFSLHSNEHVIAESGVNYSKANIETNNPGSVQTVSPSNESKDNLKFLKLHEDSLNISDILESTNENSVSEENKSVFIANAQKDFDKCSEEIKIPSDIDTNTQRSSNILNNSGKSKLEIINTIKTDVDVLSHSANNEDFNEKSLININENVQSPGSNSKIVKTEKSLKSFDEKEINDNFSPIMEPVPTSNLLPIENEIHNFTKNEKYSDVSHTRLEKKNELKDTNLEKVRSDSEKPKNTDNSTDSCNNEKVIQLTKLTRQVSKELFSPWVQKLLLYSEGLCNGLISATLNSIDANSSSSVILETEVDAISMSKSVTESSSSIANHVTPEVKVNADIADILQIEHNNDMVEKISDENKSSKFETAEIGTKIVKDVSSSLSDSLVNIIVAENVTDEVISQDFKSSTILSETDSNVTEFNKIESEPYIEGFNNDKIKQLVSDNSDAVGQIVRNDSDAVSQSLKISPKKVANHTKLKPFQKKLKVKCDVDSNDEIFKPKDVEIVNATDETMTAISSSDAPAAISCISAELIETSSKSTFETTITTENVISIDNATPQTILAERDINLELDHATIKVKALITHNDRCNHGVTDVNTECKSVENPENDYLETGKCDYTVESISQPLEFNPCLYNEIIDNISRSPTSESRDSDSYIESGTATVINNITNSETAVESVESAVETCIDNNTIDKISSEDITDIDFFSGVAIINNKKNNSISEVANINPCVNDVHKITNMETNTHVISSVDGALKTVTDESISVVSETNCHVNRDVLNSENNPNFEKEGTDCVNDITAEFYKCPNLDPICAIIENSDSNCIIDIVVDKNIVENSKPQCRNDNSILNETVVQIQPKSGKECSLNDTEDSKSIQINSMPISNALKDHGALLVNQNNDNDIEVEQDSNVSSKKIYNLAQKKSYDVSVYSDSEASYIPEPSLLSNVTVPLPTYHVTEHIIHQHEENNDTKLDNGNGLDSVLDSRQELFDSCDGKRVNIDQFKLKDSQSWDIFKNVRHTISHKRKRNGLKRSLSDSALDACSIDIHGNASVDDSENGTLLWPNKRKRIEAENVPEPQFITESYCNIIHHNRRNSISSIYNEENVSFCILIDNNCIITEDCDETEKICFTEIPEECLSCMSDASNEEGITESATEIMSQQEEMNYEYAEPFIQDREEENLEETWVEDVACVETVVSDDVAEDITVSAPISPKDSEFTDCESSNDEIGIFNVNNHTDKVKYIYGDKMCSDDAQLVETLYRTPQMDVNKTLVYRESHVMDDCNRYYDKESLEKILSETNSHEILPCTLNDIALDSATLYSAAPIKTFEEKGSLNLDIVNSISSPFEGKRREINISNPVLENIEVSQNLTKTQDDTIYSCESSIDNVFSYNQRGESPKCLISSSPEVSSTTSEERNSSILLKITNYSGSRIAQVNNMNSGSNSNKVSCKYTEKKDYLNSNSNLPNRPLITKAAQKYIPPLKETIGDLKVKLTLPQHSLIKLKQMKVSKEEPKSSKINNRKVDNICRKEYPKKPKPKFEDVLKSIDEIQFKMHKEKSKKTKCVPKVVIKKSENGSHYASTSNKDKYNPDLTGRKWQPWVFLERNIFIDEMALKKKSRAIFSHRKNTYVLAETFKKYKSMSSTKFIISQPKPDESSSSGQLKYTIRLKHNNC